MNPYLKQYQKSNLETATPERILIMLYDGAIQYLNIARLEMTSEKKLKDIPKIHNNIIGAQKIISEFQSTLNMEIGGEMAQNLYDLYTYLYNRLVDANIKKDVDALDEVLKHLKGLRDTWNKAIEIAAKEKREKSENDDSDAVHSTTTETA
ncbi:MAG: flagellar export chaperone FliS [Candidatus Gastranaerophilales bacterium]|nr:flagellar export chaperone FliS [Candidatus Gastranaerophilales bacterium]